MAYDQQLADALAENADLRRWKAMEKPLTAAMAVVASDMQKLRAEIERLTQERDHFASLLVDKEYIRTKADYNKGHLSHAGWLDARERLPTHGQCVDGEVK